MMIRRLSLQKQYFSWRVCICITLCCISDSLQENWISQVQPFIQQRIERYSANEIRFNLLALIRDRREVYREELAELKQQSSSQAGHSEITNTRMTE